MVVTALILVLAVRMLTLAFVTITKLLHWRTCVLSVEDYIGWVALFNAEFGRNVPGRDLEGET